MRLLSLGIKTAMLVRSTTSARFVSTDLSIADNIRDIAKEPIGCTKVAAVPQAKAEVEESQKGLWFYSAAIASRFV